MKPKVNSQEEILDLLKTSGEISQGTDLLGIKGRRDATFRKKLYKIPTQPSDVILDIGCNVGFLSMEYAQDVCQVQGIDNDRDKIYIARVSRDFLGIPPFSCSFNPFDIRKADYIPESFDIILSCQIHMWLEKEGMSLEDYIKKITPYLVQEGYLLFESHDIETYGKDFERKVKIVMNQGYWMVSHGEYDEHNTFYTEPRSDAKPIIKRKFVLLQKM